MYDILFPFNFDSLLIRYQGLAPPFLSFAVTPSSFLQYAEVRGKAYTIAKFIPTPSNCICNNSDLANLIGSEQEVAGWHASG